MKALIIASGTISDYNLLKSLVQENNFILCADGGLNHLIKINTIPNLVIGDLDSISKDALDYIKANNIHIERFPVMKDETDTHLALNYLIQNKYSEITIVGGIGSRIDHTLGNIYLLKSLLDKKIKGTIINENNIIHLVDKSIKIIKKLGYYTSIIPITSDGINISISGFLYPLVNDHIDFGSTRGISNEINCDAGIITINKGEALIIESRDL